MINKKKYPKPEDILPHDKPMSLVNEILNFEINSRIETKTSYKENSFFYDGHFAENPITPGVILLETMFQACGLYLRLAMEQSNEFHNILGRAVKVKEATFSHEVKPNEEIEIIANFKHRMMNFYVFNCHIVLNSKVVCKSELVLS